MVACVRSCLFNADIHWWMVNEMKVIPVLLLPLVTETEFTESEKQGMDPLLWMQVREHEASYVFSMLLLWWTYA